MWTSRGEPEIADVLAAAAARWTYVAIGSYPRFELTPPKVLVTFESRDGPALEACADWVNERIADE